MSNLAMDPPRKRLKTQHASFTNLLHSNTAPSSNLTMPAVFLGKVGDDDGLGKEAAFGMLEYVSIESSGFSGVVKKRYTDFLVNEILPSGEVVHLRNLKPVKKKDVSAQIDQQGGPAQAVENGKHGSSAGHGDIADEQNPGTPIDRIAREHNLIKQGLSNPSHSHITDTPALPTAEPSKEPPAPTIKTEPTVETMKSLEEPLPPFVKREPIAKLHDRFAPANGDGQSFSVDTVGAAPLIDLKTTPNDSKNEESGSGYGKVTEVARERHKVHLRLVDGKWRELSENEEAELQVKLEQEEREKEASGGNQPTITPGQIYSRDDAPQARTGGVASWNVFAGHKVDDAIEISEDDRSNLEAYFTPETIDGLITLFDKVQSAPDRQQKSYGQVTSSKLDRALRKRVHEDIRRIFHSKLESSTDNGGRIIISAMPKQSSFPGREPSKPTRGWNDNSHRPARGSLTWAERGGNWLHFTLYKENKDTMESINFLVRQLKNRPRDFHFAGTKDRRGVTVQRVCVYRIYLDKLMAASRQLRAATLGDFEYRPERLELGQLAGNEFVITLRDCHFEELDGSQTDAIDVETATKIVDKSVEGLVQRGFINYYGPQRFGTFAISTDQVGIAMLQGDFHRAVSAILSFRPECLGPEVDDVLASATISRDDRSRAQGINIFFETGDVHRALDLLPRKFPAEVNIIRHLGKEGLQNDFVGALNQISRNHRLMYVHAYQSLVWNFAASRRWNLFGDKVVEGDLVIVEKGGSSNDGAQVDADGELVVHAVNEDRSIDPDDVFTRARSLSKAEAESGQFTIYDVVLPTPGWDVEYPANQIGDFYRDFMASERGGGLDPHDMRRGWKDISLSGSYRKILARPGSDISFEIKTYTDEDEQFVQTDLDKYYSMHPKEDRRQKWPPRPNATMERAQAHEHRTDASTFANKGGHASQDARLNGNEPSLYPDEHPTSQGELSVNHHTPEGSSGPNPGAAAFQPAKVEGDPVELPVSDMSAEPALMVNQNPGKLPLSPFAASFEPSNTSTMSMSTDESTTGGVNISGHPRIIKLDPAVSRATTEPTSNHVANGDTPTVPAAEAAAPLASSSSFEDTKRQKIAVIIKMQLGSSTYATMALRELMKKGARVWKGDYAGGR